VTALGFALDVAAQLGDGWEAAPGAHGELAFIRHADGRGLFIHALTYPFSARGRAEVRGVYPDGWTGDREREPRITVSMGRDPAAVARDIARRLLPAYGEQLERARAYVAEAQAEESSREQVAAAITAVLPGTERDHVQPWKLGIALRLRPWGYRHTCVIRSGSDSTEVDLDLRGLPAADAVRMLAALGAVAGDSADAAGGAEEAGAVLPMGEGARERRRRLRVPARLRAVLRAA
jgi:hypothetical protein